MHYILIVVLLATSALAVEVKPTPTLSPSIKPSTSSTKPSTSSEKPSTSSAKPTSSSIKPTSSSVKPTSSSVKPTSSSVKPTSSSVKPSSSSIRPSSSMIHSSSVVNSSMVHSSMVHSSAVITSHIAPSSSKHAPPASSKVPTLPPTTTTTKPQPKYPVDAVYVSKEDHKPCVFFKANIDITYKYQDMNETTISLDGKGLNVNGGCSNMTKVNDSAFITLDWNNGDHTMTAEFIHGKGNDWRFSKFGVTLTMDKSSNFVAAQTLEASKTFKDGENEEFLTAEQDHSYQCDREDKVPLVSKNSTLYNITITINKIMVQPFSNNGTLTTKINTCSSKSESSKSSSIVPIAVGCALAGLIVIVLIAYLIGRRKSDGRGYQQV